MIGSGVAGAAVDVIGVCRGKPAQAANWSANREIKQNRTDKIM